MHDTCNTTNKVTKLIIEAMNEAGVEFYGEAEWASMPSEDRETLGGLCFNHIHPPTAGHLLRPLLGGGAGRTPGAPRRGVEGQDGAHGVHRARRPQLRAPHL